MVRRILIPLDTSPFTNATMDLGCHIAKTTGAELTGIAFLDIPGIEKSIGSIPLGGIHYADRLIESKKQDALEHISDLLGKFEEKCREEGVSFRLAERQGSPSELFIDKSMYYDLVIAGIRTYYTYEATEKSGVGIEEILDNTITPIMAVPAGFKVPDRKFKVLIAFDRSFPSVRSMHRFAQLVNTAHFEVIIFMAGDDEKEAERCLKRAKYFMDAHGFVDVKTEWTPLSPIEAMKEKYLNWADAVVLGVHSKIILIDFMIGSLSRYLIKEGKNMLLLGQ